MRVSCWGVLLALGSMGIAADDVALRVHSADGFHAPVLAGVELPDGVQALAISADGGRAAWTWAAVRKNRSRLAVHDASASPHREVELAGHLRALLFAPDNTLYVIRHRPARRREGDTELLHLDPAHLETRGQVRLPPSARALEHWPSANALLVACRDEIRTLRLPGLGSGPLYRVPGENLSVVRLSGDLLLLGREEGLLLVDLGDRAGELEMPIRERTEAPLPVVVLAVGADGASGLAGLSNGTVLRWTLNPLALAPSTSAPPARRALPEREAELPARELPPAPEPSPAPDPADRLSSAVGESAHAPAQLRGNVSGSDLEGVVVVLLGPDHLLHEAARILLGPEGSFEVRGLASGRYRVLLDAGLRAIASDPLYHVVEIRPGSPTAIAGFRIAGSR